MLEIDRCDRCGAQAYTRWRQLIGDAPVGSELLFCAHHTGRHEPALGGRFDMVEDDRGRLAESVNQPEPA